MGKPKRIKNKYIKINEINNNYNNKYIELREEEEKKTVNGQIQEIFNRMCLFYTFTHKCKMREGKVR